MPARRGLLSVGLVLFKCHRPSEKLLAPAALGAHTPRLGAKGAWRAAFPQGRAFSPCIPRPLPYKGQGDATVPTRAPAGIGRGGKVALGGATHAWGVWLGAWWGWAWPRDRAFGQRV